MNPDTATATDTSTDLDPKVTSAPPAQTDVAPIPANATNAKLTLHEIKERDGYLRDIDDAHVNFLVASISDRGLLHPLVVVAGSDELAAGRHRYRALIKMSEQDPARFEAMFPEGKVSVRRFDLGENPSQEAIIALELTENGVRQDYTDAEIVVAAETLKRMGYGTKRGRPGKHDRPVGPVLMRMFGISESTLHRALSAVRRRDKLSRDGITSDGQGTPRVAPARSRKAAASPDDATGDGATVNVGSTFVESEEYAAACTAVLKLGHEERLEFAIFLKRLNDRNSK